MDERIGLSLLILATVTISFAFDFVFEDEMHFNENYVVFRGSSIFSTEGEYIGNTQEKVHANVGKIREVDDFTTEASAVHTEAQLRDTSTTSTEGEYNGPIKEKMYAEGEDTGPSQENMYASVGKNGEDGNFTSEVPRKENGICVFTYTVKQGTKAVEQIKNITGLTQNWFVMTNVSIEEEGIIHVSNYPQERYIILKVNETYETLYKKTGSLLRFIGDRVDTVFKSCKWFIKMDDDSYINFPLLEDALSCRDPMEYLYTGFYIRPHGAYKSPMGEEVQLNFATGAAIVLSRGIAINLKIWVPRDFVWLSSGKWMAEDILIGAMLKRNRVCYELLIVNLHVTRSQIQIQGRSGHDLEMQLDTRTNTTKGLCLLYVHKMLPYMFPIVEKRLKRYWSHPFVSRCAGHICSMSSQQVEAYKQKRATYSECDPERYVSLRHRHTEVRH
mmetsp:Transcript_20406/g.30539  ORF Transcript_20406/g.30539 Transcript_20406/m.30539 type:complete len:444 (+) Transcript_20406:48-1379(+)